MVCKRVRGRTSGSSLPVLIFLLPPGEITHLLQNASIFERNSNKTELFQGNLTMSTDLCVAKEVHGPCTFLKRSSFEGYTRPSVWSIICIQRHIRRFSSSSQRHCCRISCLFDFRDPDVVITGSWTSQGREGIILFFFHFVFGFCCLIFSGF